MRSSAVVRMHPAGRGRVLCPRDGLKGIGPVDAELPGENAYLPAAIRLHPWMRSISDADAR